MPPRYRVGIDVGGTFTDAISIDQETGVIASAKVLTVVGDQAKGVTAALRDLKIPPQDIGLLVHGFTVGINAVLTRTGAKTGLLCTWGHRDVLAIQRTFRGSEPSHTYNPRFKHVLTERPLVERRYRRQIEERTLYDGSERWAVDEDQVRNEVEFLKSEGITSIAICFMNAYACQDHEQQVKKIVQEVFPEAYVSTSSINPAPKEYERTVTVVLDAYIGAVVRQYLTRLSVALEAEGYQGDVLILQMPGGATSLENAKKVPVLSLMSGPVGGALATQNYAQWFEKPNLLMMDIGGTSTDFCMVQDYQVDFADEKDVEHRVTVLLPQIAVTSIGAGGGSLIHRDSAGVLKVGPQSAGAKPGPACYGLGGTEPALSDAYVVMGFLQPEYFLGGRMPLHSDLAEKALARVAEAAGLSVQEAAQTAFELNNVTICEAIRRIAAYRGLDTREFSLVAIGSAGPMHASFLIRELAMSEAIIPLHPGAVCAYGMVTTDVKAVHTAGAMKRLDELTGEEFDELFKHLEAKGIEELKGQGFTSEKIRVERVYKGMYKGQTWDIRIPVPPGPYDDGAMQQIKESFHARYLQSFGHSIPDHPIVVASVQSTVIGEIPPMTPPKLEWGGSAPPANALLDRKEVYLDGQTCGNVPFYQRGKLLAGNVIHGPAIVVEDFSTTVVGRGFMLSVDDRGPLRIRCD